MSLNDLVHEPAVRRQIAERKIERQKEAVARRARLKALPGYLPVALRPKCRHCDKRMPIFIYSHERARYGYQGHGVFCSLGCGYWYGVHAAGGRA